MLSNLQQTQTTHILKTLLENSSEINAAVVTTLDGHPCAKEQRDEYALERLATMGSTLMSLGDTITAELRMGSCRNIIAENEGGIIAFMHINQDLVLVTLTQQLNALGMLLAHSRRCAADIARTLK